MSKDAPPLKRREGPPVVNSMTVIDHDAVAIREAKEEQERKDRLQTEADEMSFMVGKIVKCVTQPEDSVLVTFTDGSVLDVGTCQGYTDWKLHKPKQCKHKNTRTGHVGALYCVDCGETLK
jgi:hypothetical protein